MSGQPAARLGDGTYMGGPITQGSSGVMIGSPNGKACSTCPGSIAVGNPVNPMLGAKILHNETDLALTGDLSLIISRSYSSYQTPTPSAVGMFGPGWQTQMGMSLTVTPQQLIFHDTAGRSLYFEALTEGGIGYSQSENLWVVRGGREQLAIKDHSLTVLWESIPLEIRMDRDYYFVTNNILGPVAILGYVSPYVPDNQKVLPQPLSQVRVLLMEANRFGHVIRYERHDHGDFKGCVYKVVDGSGRIYRLEYEKLFPQNTHHAPKFGYGDDSGVRLTAVYLTGDSVFKTVPDKALVRYDYTQRGELMTVFDRSNTITREFFYDKNYLGRMVGHNYAGRPVTIYEYNSEGKVIQQRNPQGLDYTFQYEASAVEVIDSLGRKDRYEFEGEGGLKRLVKHIRKDGSIVRNEFDSHGRLIAQIDALNRKTEFELNISSGLLVKTITSDGREFQFNYNRFGQITEMTSPNGQKSETTFDDLGRRIEQKNDLGETTRYHYEGRTDRLSSIEDAMGKQKKITWTRYGQIETFTDCSGKTTQYKYNQWGETTKITHEEGLFERYQYDKQGRLVASDNTTNDITEYSYNDANDLISVVLPNKAIHQINHDVWGNITAQTFGGLTQKFAYDSAGRLTQLTNENGAQMSFKYDVMDRLTQEIGFDGRTKEYRYDPLGRMTNSQDVSILSHYQYDGQDRLIERTIQKDELKKKIALHYGAAGLSECSYDDGEELVSVKYSYDALGRISQESQGIDREDQNLWYHEVNHDYNALGLRDSSEINGLPPIHYQTYGSGHLIGVMLGKTALVDFERDDLHRETERRFGPLILQHQYNERGDLAGIISANPDYSPLDRHYSYDQIGQLTTTMTHKGTINYQYDLSGRLTQMLSPTQDKHYEYDAAGNIQPKGMSQLYSVFDDNHVIEDQDYHYSYDLFGNLIEKRHKTLAEVHSYQYDLEHRLIHYDYHNGHTDERRESHYQYDPFGRRVRKTINHQNYWYGWDGDRLVTTETDQSRINTIYHPGSFAPLVRIEQALPLTEKIPTLSESLEAKMGIPLPKLVQDRFNAIEDAIRKNQLTDNDIQWMDSMMLTQESIKEMLPAIPKQHPMQIHYYHCDQVGTPLALIRNTGEVDWAIELDPFGNMIAENGADRIHQPIRMQGQQYDEETGLHYNRYRYYDPQLGRYISQDPIGLAGGMNNYIYPLNPVQVVDPLGLQGLPGYNIHPSHIPFEPIYSAPIPTQASGFTGSMGYKTTFSGAALGEATFITGYIENFENGKKLYDCSFTEICAGVGPVAGASTGYSVEMSNALATTGFSFGLCLSGEMSGGVGANTGGCVDPVAAAIDKKLSVSGDIGIKTGAKAGASAAVCTRYTKC